MLTRRQFARDVAGTVATMLVGGGGADRTGIAYAQQPGASGGRRQVTIGGRRLRTIDIHAHCEIPGIREIMGGKPVSLDSSTVIGPNRLREMDQQGIDVEILSINPFWYEVDRDVATRLIRTQNERLAETCAAHPDRLVGLATVALQHPDLAARQLEEGVKTFGLKGGSLGASIGSEELASERFDPFWAKAQELDVPILIHPQGVAELAGRLKGNGVLTNVIGNPLATTIALSHLIFQGTMDRFPRLKIVAMHGGGYLASYPDRSDHGCLTFPEQCNRKLQKRPTEYIKQFYVDSLVFTSEALRHLVAVMGVSHVMLGTDHPFPWVEAAVDHVLKTPELSDADRIAILNGNAAKLFNILL